MVVCAASFLVGVNAPGILKELSIGPDGAFIIGNVYALIMFVVLTLIYAAYPEQKKDIG